MNDLKRQAIENNSVSVFNGSASEDLDNRRSRLYRITGSPYGYMIYFENFIFYVELIQQGVGCDRGLLNHKYPIAYVDPSEDLHGRQRIKCLNQCPIDIDKDSLSKAIAGYIKTIRFRTICDSFKLTTSIAILEDGAILTGKSAYKIYTQFKTVYDGKKVLTSWIPFKDRPSEIYKDRRDSSKCYAYRDEKKTVKKFKLNGR